MLSPRSRALGTAWWLFAFADVLLLSRGAAGEPPPQRFQLVQPTVEGFTEQDAAGVREKILEQLQSAGFEFTMLTPEMAPSAGCREDFECLREAGAQLGARGLLVIAVLRSGPMVRTQLRLYDADEALLAFETSLLSAVEGFPENAPLAETLRPILESLLGVARTEKPAVTAEPPPPPDPINAVNATPPTPAAPPRPALRMMGWVAIGLGGAMLASSATCGGLALDLDRELADRCADGVCPPSEAGAVDRLQHLAQASDILLGVGLTAAVAGTLLVLLSPVGPSTESDVRVQPALHPGGLGAAIEGRF